MKNKDISNKKNSVIKAIESKNLHEAFKLMRGISEAQMTWEITDEINRLEQSYRYMLEYAMRGAVDPSRHAVYSSLIAGMLTLMDRLERHALTPDTSTLYYNTLRYRNHATPESIPELLRNYIKATADSSLFNLVIDSNPDEAKRNRNNRERLEREIFEAIWVTFPLSVADYEALQEAILSATLPDHLKQLIISGLMLGAFEYYDSKRIQLLSKAYYSGNNVISSTSIIALLLTLHHYRHRELDNAATNSLKVIYDVPTWQSDLKDAFLELVRARDTERITRKMNDEVVPEMMKLKPELNKKFRDFQKNIDISELEENPEWQEMLEKSGIADKLKELTEIQLEGGDVFMSTFAHLKNFPFFNEIANWFMPFHSDHSEVLQLPDELKDISVLLEGTQAFCNSDKYSFILSLQNIPPTQRQLMKTQMNAQIQGMIELKQDELNTELTNRRSIMNRYVQDLYRFFRLFQRKEEFNDPFTTDLNLVTIPALSGQFSDNTSLQAIAEFYFKHKYYRDALNIFKIIEQNTYPDNQLFEKMGYCYEREGEIEKALRYYEQAELLDAQSLWTLRHIARCFRLLGQPEKALDYYRRVAEKEADESIATDMAFGNCLLEMKRWNDAAKYYFKVRYLEPDSTRALRPLAWSLLMQHDYKRAKELYDEVLRHNPTSDDYLNMGHLALATHDHENALNFYKLSINAGDGLHSTLARKLNDDADALASLGIEQEIIPLILDSIKYTEI